jgi:hypothetical protein
VYFIVEVLEDSEYIFEDCPFVDEKEAYKWCNKLNYNIESRIYKVCER